MVANGAPADNQQSDEDRDTMRNYRDTMRWQGGKARGPRTRASGFTLAELLISIGILGVGLTMSAALFPAGLDANKNSANDLLGTMICQNGLAAVKAKVSAAHIMTTDYVSLQDPALGIFSAGDLTYPSGGSGDAGCYVFGRQITAGRNEYELMVIAYQKQPGGKEVSLQKIVGRTNATPTFTFTTGASYAQAGASIIVTRGYTTTTNGGFARVVSMAGTVATLDKAIPGIPQKVDAMILYQEGAPVSPVLSVMTSRTSLPAQLPTP